MTQNRLAGREVMEPTALFPAATLLLVVFLHFCAAEPVVIRGALLPELLGKPVSTLRLCDREGNPIPFQVDEVTLDGEYVCDRGSAPNVDAGNGVLDKQDEIVFLREDGAPCSNHSAENMQWFERQGRRYYPLRVGNGDDCRIVHYTDDTTVQRSSVSYIEYDHSRQLVTTPRYYARFGKDRFHFVDAGVKNDNTKGWIPLTNELRIEIHLRALWGIFPVRYNEDNLVCYVQRYKVGPLRLIRRGDFHLRMGLGLKGSRAAVNQLCYPYMVAVPVRVHIPVRFRSFFREAWLEMTPVIAKGGSGYVFSVPHLGVAHSVAGPRAVDTLMRSSPNRNLFTLLNEKQHGFGWLLQTDIPDSSAEGSGYVFRRPSLRGGIVDCGYRLAIQDVARGRYTITNWVCFALKGGSMLDDTFRQLATPVVVHSTTKSDYNRINNSGAPDRQ